MIWTLVLAIAVVFLCAQAHILNKRIDSLMSEIRNDKNTLRYVNERLDKYIKSQDGAF